MLCLSNCPYGYYKQINGKECVNICTGGYIDLDNQECTNYDGKFKLQGKDSNSGINICYNECPSYTYYINGDNNKICYYYPPNKDCYFKEDDFSIFYHSCIDLIDESYKYVGNNICYKKFNCGDRYYYKDNDGIYRCIPEKAVRGSENQISLL